MKYRERADLNREYGLLLDSVGALEQFNGFILSTDAKRIDFGLTDLRTTLIQKMDLNSEDFSKVVT